MPAAEAARTRQGPRQVIRVDTAAREPGDRPRGHGGVAAAGTAVGKSRAVADLFQFYTGMIYAGPKLPGRLVSGMADFVSRQGLASIRDIRDQHLERWTAKTL